MTAKEEQSLPNVGHMELQVGDPTMLHEDIQKLELDAKALMDKELKELHDYLDKKLKQLEKSTEEAIRDGRSTFDNALGLVKRAIAGRLNS